MDNELSAIVVLAEDDVHSVFIIPTEQATYDDLHRLRAQVREAGDRNIKIQRVPYAGINSPFSNIESISRQLADILRERT